MRECKIAERLIKLRRAKDVTQEEMAKSLNISNKTISKWENGASTPDLEMLVKLSEYFGVTTDALLGIAQHEDRSTEQMLRFELRGLDRKETVFKAFDIVRSIIPAESERLAIYKYVGDHSSFPPDSLYGRYCISTPDFFEYASSSDNANIAILHLPNKANFSWLKDPACQQRLVRWFDFLADADNLSVCYFIHSMACSESFTADYVAKNTDISEEKVKEILDSFCNMGFCQSTEAHLEEGTVRIYESYGDGLLLSVLSIAYERTCNYDGFQYNLKGSNKMIGDLK